MRRCETVAQGYAGPKLPVPDTAAVGDSTARSRPVVVIAGASGYIGGRLLRRLTQEGVRVRGLTREPSSLRHRIPATAEICRGDALDIESLRLALKGVQTAYYLVHSMAAGARFREIDRQAAENFGRAALEEGVRRIIYLGGLGSGRDLSTHLESRHEVGRLLRASGVVTLEFRASIILGSDSLSFEMLRTLVDRLPVMITPRWTRTLAQPIAVEDVVSYLAAALDWKGNDSAVFEIGGADRVSYLDLMRDYARIRGLRRLIVPVPCLTPRLSSLWLGLVTPVYASVGRHLIEGVRNETVVTNHVASRTFPVEPMTAVVAIQRALTNEDREFSETRWSDAYRNPGVERKWGGARFGRRIVDSRTIVVNLPARKVFPLVEAVGGDTGWYYGNWLWKLRGFLDLLVGGVGSRRGRRHPRKLMPGDTVDFWRVEQIEAGRRLRLRAEMRLPGRAWLEFEVEPDGPRCTLRQTAEFDPAGWTGQLYWYALFPVHGLIFRKMLDNIARAALGRNQDFSR